MSNVFSFTGTCGKDAEVRFSAGGLAILNVRVANNIGFGDKQQTLWIQVTLFGKRAEGSLKDYLRKGQQVFVSGELTQREYQANDGTTRSSLELNANIIDLVGKRNESNQSFDSAQGKSFDSAQGRSSQVSPAAQQAPSHDNFDAPYDDDIPF